MKMPIALLSLIALLIGLVPLLSAQGNVESLCLVTDVGTVDDGTFNQLAHEGALKAAAEFDLAYRWIETAAAADYDANIRSCIDDGYQVVVTVGYLIADSAYAAAEAHPHVFFLGVDHFLAEGPLNYAGIQVREDQSGFLAGVLAARVADSIGSDTVAGIYGIDIPPVVKFRNGFEQGARYINANLNLLGVYIDSFIAPERGALAAEEFIDAGAAVIFGAGGPTGSGGILAAARQGVYVIGVEQDEWLTSFNSGETPGSEYIISSALRRLDRGVYDLVAALAEGNFDFFPGGGVYLLDAAMNGIGLAPAHESDIDETVWEKVAAVQEMLAAGEIETGVDAVTGELLDDQTGREAPPSEG